MAFTRGRCTNFDYCSIAESRRDIEVRVGEDFICPECGKPLKAPQVKGGGGSPVVPVLIGVVVLAALGGAVFLGMRVAGTTPSGGTPVASAGSPGSGAEIRQAAPAPNAGSANAGAPAAPSTPATTAAPLPSNTTPAAGSAAAALPEKPSALPVAVPARPAENVLFHLRGSGAMASAIMAPLAAAYLAQIGDTDVATTQQSGEIHVSGSRGGTLESIVISGDGAVAGFKALADGSADTVFSERPIQAAEQAAGTAGPPVAHVLALDAAAVVVSPANPTAAVSRSQVQDIFSGAITNWRAVGGPDAPMSVYTASTGGAAAAASVTTTAPNARQEPGDQAVSAAVAADPRGIGLVDLASVGQARVVPIAATGTVPVSPLDHAAVASGDYPLAYRLYLYTSPKAPNGFAQRFADYAMSQQGQAVLAQHGLVSPAMAQSAPSPAPSPAPVPAVPQTEADKLKAFVKGAKRLSIVFRFQPNGIVLDQYGERDVDRVLNYLVSLHEGGDHLLLAGFADNQGDPAQNETVSLKRAQSVAALFAQRGITPGGVEGFGGELPVADNGTEAGRERNRRVEVYIRR